jgi:hypothetical protein
MEREKVWNTNELGKAAGVSGSYIRRLCSHGRLPGAYKAGRDWLVPAKVGEAWLAERRKRWEKFS